MKEPDRYDPVSASHVEIHCRIRYDVRFTIPPRKTVLSGAQIRSALQEYGFESTIVHTKSGFFRLSYSKIGHPDRVVVEVAPVTNPEVARVSDGQWVIAPDERYPWVMLIWEAETFMRSRYGHTPDMSDMEVPSIIDVAVKALRAASDQP